MTPGERHARDLERAGFRADPAQAEAVELLDDLHARLCGPRPQPSRLARLLAPFRGSPRIEPVKGLYMWGGVGRGKTYLMDLFH